MRDAKTADVSERVRIGRDLNESLSLSIPALMTEGDNANGTATGNEGAKAGGEGNIH